MKYRKNSWIKTESLLARLSVDAILSNKKTQRMPKSWFDDTAQWFVAVVVLPTKCRQVKMAGDARPMKKCVKCKYQKCLENIVKAPRIRRFLVLNLAKVHEVDTILQETAMQQPTLADFLLTSRTLHHYGIPRIAASVLWRAADIGSQSANGVSFRFQPQ